MTRRGYAKNASTRQRAGEEDREKRQGNQGALRTKCAHEHGILVEPALHVNGSNPRLPPCGPAFLADPEITLLVAAPRNRESGARQVPEDDSGRARQRPLADDSGPPDSQVTLTLTAARQLALRMSPSLVAPTHRVQGARALIKDARRRPNPELEGTIENFGGSLGTRLAETTLVIRGLYLRSRSLKSLFSPKTAGALPTELTPAFL